MSNFDEPSDVTSAPTDGDSNAPCDVSGGSCCGFTKVIRSLAFLAVLGTAAAYGALLVKPELSEYLSFIPGDQPAKSCPMSGCSSGCSCSSSCVSQDDKSIDVAVPKTATDEASEIGPDALEAAVATDAARIVETGTESGTDESSATE